MGCVSTTTVQSRFSMLVTMSKFCEEYVGWGRELEMLVSDLDVLAVTVEQSLVILSVQFSQRQSSDKYLALLNSLKSKRRCT